MKTLEDTTIHWIIALSVAASQIGIAILLFIPLIKTDPQMGLASEVSSELLAT